MKILFIHPNFPGQFKHLAKHYASFAGNEVIFACRNPNQVEIENVTKLVVSPANYQANKNIHSYLREFEIATFKAQSMWRALFKLKNNGFIPDVIYAHPGWGDGLLIKEIYPESKYIAYMEFFYRYEGADSGFGGAPISDNHKAKTRIRNCTNLINMEAADWLISPTKWQANLHPFSFHHKLSVIHEGIDTKIVDPMLVNNDILTELKIPNDAEIITYSARNLEPYRGFDKAMKAFEILCKARPKAHFIIVGGDGVSYSSKLPNGETYRQKLLSEVNIDATRFHFVGNVPYSKYLSVLKASMAHIYLTYPFVLSWSFHEAMAMQCPMVVSNTAPVLEVAEDNVTALVADFFSPEDIAQKITKLLDNKNFAMALGKNARKKIQAQYSLDVILPQYTKLIEDVMKLQ